MSQPAIIDQEQRLAAIDPNRSFIVQAPAGSGKTELLIQRYLALLSGVEKPQQILAITFTRKAAAEMRARVLEALAAALRECPEEPHKKKTWQLASQALKRDRSQGWNILENPSLLMIQTIDSFNAALVRKMPWLSRFGGLPELAEDADRLYLAATDRILKRLGTDQPGAEALATLLEHLDSRVDRLQSLLVEMLRKRDQWLRHLVGITGEDPRDLLEHGLAQFIEASLSEMADLLPPALHEEILFCGRYAAANLADEGERPLLEMAALEEMPGTAARDLRAWQGIADLLLTAGDELRSPRGVTKTCGFPTGKEGQSAKQRMQEIIAALEPLSGFVTKLARCRHLPQARYADEQWKILQALVALLPLLVVELWGVFRGEGKSDFAEISMKALAALGSADDPSDLLLNLDARMEHILVDEFQDTNLMQYELLKTLTAGWQPGDGRTLFLVGDPMQSIYRFREAEVSLFLKTFQGWFGETALELTPLQLKTNFRSQQGIVEWVNDTFARIFPAQVDVAAGAVPLATAAAVHPLLPGPACRLHAFNGRNDRAEAEALVAELTAERGRHPDQVFAVLVRSRTHLPEILRLLKQHRIPFQAQEIDQLGERPVALDILALTRALLHRADRLSWLAVLRAPWAGLTLTDLHALVEDAPKDTVPSLLEDRRRWAAMSEDGRARLEKVWPILAANLSRRGRIGLRPLVEGCWLALGGPAFYAGEDVENAEIVFALLETLERGGELPDWQVFEQRLGKLFAATDSTADGKLQVLTVHKSKGLEYDQVFLPGLGRKPRGDDAPLLRWLEHPQHGLLLAPIAPRDGSGHDPIYQMIGALEAEKQSLETARLIYVAATRAKKRLHLFGHAKENSKGELIPEAGSLLEILWPVVQEDFTEAAVTTDTQAMQRRLVLRRRPLEWSMPELVTAALPEQVLTGRASNRNDSLEQLSSWNNHHRHVGTVVHRLFEHIGKKGISHWEEMEDGLRTRVISRQLGMLGVPAKDHASGVAQVRQAIDKALAGERGRWILAAHPEGACEWALSGVLEGTLTHAVIDRTFVDHEGTRWVIDYKTSQLDQGETLDDFLSRERELYQGQLNVYRELFRALEPERAIEAALYFPMLDAWCPLEG